jgi:hypothetical protein
MDLGQYMEDGKGRLVPIGVVKEIDKVRDSLVKQLVSRGQELHEKMAAFKQLCLSEIMSFVALSAMEWDVSMGGEKGNMTLYSFDMRYKAQIQISETFVFDEQLQIAKRMIDDCLKDWSQGTRSEIKAIINDAFQVDKEGRIDTKRILGLRRLDIQDPLWKNAMDAISASLQVAGSKRLFRLYKRNSGTDRWIPIVLKMDAI